MNVTIKLVPFFTSTKKNIMEVNYLLVIVEKMRDEK
jgi:hypothetical protein